MSRLSLPLAGFLVVGGAAYALPTMVRLGYPNCVSCHISPQGGGLLNAYGRGIDEAQSFSETEYKPPGGGLARTLSWGGRITQDLRMVSLEQVSTGTNQPVLGRFRSRLMYRNATELGRGFRVSAIFMGENEHTPRPSTPYERPVRPGDVYVNTALVHYRPRDGLEFAAGRDLLPGGILTSDLSPFIRSRNRRGYYDTPTQVKMFWWGKRYQVSPFAYGPSDGEPAGERESGGGALAEFDVLGNQKTILGVSLLRGTAVNGNRRMIGAYTRLGFGQWGILAEHDITDREVDRPAPASFRQHASFAQVFWYPREWLVVSLIGEHLSVGRPYREHLNAVKIEVAARLTPNLTIGINTRGQRNMLTGAWAPSVGVQLAMKTVN
jgi:hypothetical protein